MGQAFHHAEGCRAAGSLCAGGVGGGGSGAGGDDGRRLAFNWLHVFTRVSASLRLNRQPWRGP